MGHHVQATRGVASWGRLVCPTFLLCPLPLKADRLLPECSLPSDNKESLKMTLPFPVPSSLGCSSMNPYHLFAISQGAEPVQAMGNHQTAALATEFFQETLQILLTSSATEPADAVAGAGLSRAAGTLCRDAMASHRRLLRGASGALSEEQSLHPAPCCCWEMVQPWRHPL